MSAFHGSTLARSGIDSVFNVENEVHDLTEYLNLVIYLWHCGVN